jgi:malonyl CoA-acyl carrier protein transacylase
VFREALDRCAAIAQSVLGFDIREILSASADAEKSAEALKQTSVTQPTLFAIEYALAGVGSGSGPLQVSTLLAFAGFFLLVSGAPLIAAFFATRGLTRLFGGASR